MLQDFFVTYQVASFTVGQTQKMRSMLLDFQLSASKLESLLDQDWNTSLPVRHVRRGECSSVEAIGNVGTGNVSVDEHQNLLGVENVVSPNVCEDYLTKKLKFVVVTPKVDMGKLFQCGVCDLKYESKKALTRHCQLNSEKEKLL